MDIAQRLAIRGREPDQEVVRIGVVRGPRRGVIARALRVGFNQGGPNSQGSSRKDAQAEIQLHPIPVFLADTLARFGGPPSEEPRENRRVIQGGIDRSARPGRGSNNLADFFPPGLGRDALRKGNEQERDGGGRGGEPASPTSLAHVQLRCSRHLLAPKQALQRDAEADEQSRANDGADDREIGVISCARDHHLAKSLAPQIHDTPFGPDDGPENGAGPEKQERDPDPAFRSLRRC